MGWGKTGSDYSNGHRAALGDDESILQLTAVMAVQRCKYTKSHWAVHFKCVICKVCELYLNKTVIKKFNDNTWKESGKKKMCLRW